MQSENGKFIAAILQKAPYDVKKVNLIGAKSHWCYVFLKMLFYENISLQDFLFRKIPQPQSNPEKAWQITLIGVLQITWQIFLKSFKVVERQNIFLAVFDKAGKKVPHLVYKIYSEFGMK